VKCRGVDEKLGDYPGGMKIVRFYLVTLRRWSEE